MKLEKPLLFGIHQYGCKYFIFNFRNRKLCIFRSVTKISSLIRNEKAAKIFFRNFKLSLYVHVYGHLAA